MRSVASALQLRQMRRVRLHRLSSAKIHVPKLYIHALFALGLLACMSGANAAA